MGNVIVGYVQLKNYFTEQPSLSASRARLTTRSLPVLKPLTDLTSLPSSAHDAGAAPEKHAGGRVERASTARDGGRAADTTSLDQVPPAAPASSSTSEHAATSQATRTSAPVMPSEPGPFSFTLPGVEGWADTSRGTWHAPAGPAHRGVGRSCQLCAEVRTRRPWSRDTPSVAAATEPRAAACALSAETVNGASSSAMGPGAAEDTSARGTPGLRVLAANASDKEELGMQADARAAAEDSDADVDVVEAEAELALLGTMDCADAHAYYYPPDKAYEAMDSATLRHPDTLWLSSARDLAVAYTHGSGKQRGPLASSFSSLVSSASAASSAFVGLAEELCLLAERQPDALALSWRHVERVERTSSTDVSHYMGVPQCISYGALSARVQSFRLGLRSLGLVEGDGLALMVQTRWEWLVTCYAAWSLGLVVTVLHDDPLCVRQAVLEADDNLKCVVCAAHMLPQLQRGFRERYAAREADEEEGVASEEDGDDVQAESCEAAAALKDEETVTPIRPRARRPRSRRHTAPTPLFVVLHNDDARAEGGEGTQRRPSPTPSERANGPAPAREEEALWWFDVMEAGRVLLYHVAVRHAHEQRRRQHRPPPSQSRLTYSHCARVRPTDLALIVYTEGDCRGVLLTHGALRAAVTSHAEYLQEAGIIATTTASSSSTTAATCTASDLAAVEENDDGAEEATEGVPLSASGVRRRPCVAWAEAEDADKARTEEDVLHRLSRSGLGGERAADWPATPLTGSLHPAGRYTSPTSASSAAALLSRVLLAAVYGDVRSSTSEAVSGCQSWWQQQQAVVRSHLSLHLGGGGDHGPHARPSYVLCEPLHRIRELVLVSTLLLRAHVTVCLGHRETLLDHHHHRVYPCSDVKLYKPVLLSLDPSTLESLRHTVQSSVRHPGYTSVLFTEGYRARRAALQRGLETPYLNTSVFTQTRQLLGGRCRLVLSHGAALAPCVQEYVQVVCGAAVVQWYTLTEACGCGLAQLPWDGLTRNMGGPMGGLEMKLRDAVRAGHLWPCEVADLGSGSVGSSGGESLCGSQGDAFSDRLLEKDVRGVGIGGRTGRHSRCEVSWWLHDAAVPAGELLLRGAAVFSGYHAQPERTVAALDRSGWLHTGDVVERHHASDLGSFRVVDRLHTRAKTAAACTVSLERLEAVYRHHPLCEGDDVCVLVHPFSSLVVALVVTTEPRARRFYHTPECQNALHRLAEAGGTTAAPSSPVTSDEGGKNRVPRSHVPASPLTSFAWSASLGDPRFNAAAAESFAQWGVSHELPRSACVRRVRLVYDDWARLRTATGRLRRHAIHQYYTSLIEELFQGSSASC